MGLFNFKREIKWDKDVMKVTDSVSNIWNSVVDEMSDKMKNEQTAEVLRHFDIDMSELREYLRDKEYWNRKQAEAIPHWIPVTERLPENDSGVLAFYDDGIGSRIIPATFHPKSGWYDCLFNMPSENISYWMPLPEPPEEEEHE